MTKPRVIIAAGGDNGTVPAHRRPTANVQQGPGYDGKPRLTPSRCAKLRAGVPSSRLEQFSRLVEHPHAHRDSGAHALRDDAELLELPEDTLQHHDLRP
jgi:hypothetical protein